jgi:hypothetical protein
MKLAFLGLTAEQRSRAIEEAAARQGVSPVIIEKDFWVCFALSLLYRSEFGESLVFKGGTSLSKVFGAIRRFSEDIDLSLAPEFLNLPKPGLSRNQANKWMLLAELACVEAVRDRITPELNRQLAIIVQDRPAGLRLDARFEFQVAPPWGRTRLSLFLYPNECTRKKITDKTGVTKDLLGSGTHWEVITISQARKIVTAGTKRVPPKVMLRVFRSSYAEQE